MAEPPSAGSDPFSGMPFFGDLARAMAGQGPINWEAARQFAQLGATGGIAESNVEPSTRVAIGELAPIQPSTPVDYPSLLLQHLPT